MINLKRQRGINISQRIQDECFTAEQKAVLEYTQGTIQISIKDQLDRLYGDRFVIKDEEYAIKEAAQIVHEYSYLIDDIKDLKQKIIRLKDPGAYRATTSAVSKSAACNKTSNDSDSMNFTRTLSYATTDTNTGMIVRNINSEPDQLVEGADALDDSKRISKPTITKKQHAFTTNEMSKDKFMTIQENVEQKIPGVIVSDNYEYHNLSLTKEGQSTDTNANTYTEDRRLNELKSNLKSASSTVTDSKNTIDVEADSVLKSLTVDIPRLRSKFWSKFSLLYTFCDPC